MSQQMGDIIMAKLIGLKETFLQALDNKVYSWDLQGNSTLLLELHPGELITDLKEDRGNIWSLTCRRHLYCNANIASYYSVLSFDINNHHLVFVDDLGETTICHNKKRLFPDRISIEGEEVTLLLGNRKEIYDLDFNKLRSEEISYYPSSKPPTFLPTGGEYATTQDEKNYAVLKDDIICICHY